jgi:predicted DNA-binding transcriptional regulator AlpA
MKEKKQTGPKVNPVHGYLTAEELADLLRVSKSSIYRAAGKTLPPFHPVLGSKRFRADEIAAWQAAGEVWPIPTPADGRG